MRLNGRSPIELRPVRITLDYIKYPEGSVLFEIGNTRVLCNASIVNSVPTFLEGSDRGWVTGEYSMLPRATHTRKSRESYGRVSGRTHEIQRLIGRSLRAICDLKKLKGKSVYLDCDVLQADGGTRTAAITGGYIALMLACSRLVGRGELIANPVMDPVAAISVGIQKGTCMVDLDYEEDSSCDVDMNVVMTGSGRFVEIQGTAEQSPFSVDEQKQMLEAAAEGIQALVRQQAEALQKAEL